MSCCVYVESKAERHLVPAVLNSLFFGKKMPNPKHTFKYYFNLHIFWICAVTIV